MAGIVLESIAACRRATYCLRSLRASQRPFILYPSMATRHHRCRRHISSDDTADDTSKDKLHQMKPIQLGQGQLVKDSDGLKVTSAPPDPKETPPEKRTELPFEVTPEIPMEAQPNRIQPAPLEIKPPNPHTIICSSDSKTLDSTNEAAKGVDPNIESETKAYSTSSNELPPPPVVNLMDDQTPAPTTSEVEFEDPPFISIECDLDYPSTTVHEYVNARYQAPSTVKSDTTSQGFSASDPKTENTQSPTESKDDQYSQDSHSASQDELKTQAKDSSAELKAESKSQFVSSFGCPRSESPTDLPITSDLESKDVSSTKTEASDPNPETRIEFKPQTLSIPEVSGDVKTPLVSQDDSHSMSEAAGSSATLDLKVTADNSERSSQPMSVGSGWPQGSSLDLPGKGKIAGQEAEVIYSSAKDEYNNQYSQILGKDQEMKRNLTEEKIRENVVDNEIIDQWVDKFKRLYLAENAAFGLNNENEVPASSDKKNSDSKDEKDSKRLRTMVMKDNKWVFENKDAAEPSTSTTDKSNLPQEIDAKLEASGNEKNEKLLHNMVLRDNKWVIESKDTAEKVSTASDPVLTTTNKSNQENDFPANTEAKPEASSDKKNETPVLTMVLKNNEWVIENKDTVENVSASSDPSSSTTDKTSPGGTLPLNIETKPEAPNNKRKEMPLLTMMLKDNEWVIVSKDTLEKVSTPSDPVSPTTKSSHEGEFSLDPEAKQADFSDSFSAPKDEKVEKPLISMVKKDNAWALGNKDTTPPISPSPEPTLNDDERTLQQKIVNKHEASTEFRESKKDLPTSDKDAPGATTKPIELILDQSSGAVKSEAEVSGSPAGDSQSSTDEISSTLDLSSDSNVNADNAVESSADFIVKDQEPTTEEIIAMFKDDFINDLNKTEDGETLDGRTMGSQEDILGSHDAEDVASNDKVKLDQVRADKDADDYFTHFLDFEESTPAHEAEKAQENDKFIGSSVGMENSEKDVSFEQTNFNLAEKVSSFIKASEDSDSSEINQNSLTSTSPTDLNDPISSEISSSAPMETAEVEESLETSDKSHTETTAILPDDLYEPISYEVSSPALRQAAPVEESEDLNSGLKTKEVEAKEEETTVPSPQAKQETKDEVSGKTPASEKPEKKDKPQLEQGELAMKLLDKDAAETPSPASEKPSPATEKPSPVTETPTSSAKIPPPPAKTLLPAEKLPAPGVESQTPGEKSFIQKLFDRILGGRGKNEGKRQMSTYTIQRQLSTSCTFALPPSPSPNGAKDYRQGSPVRTMFTMGLVHGENQELKLELFAKDTKDLTEIKGGSPSCSSPKKSPRDLMLEKKNSKKITILGGSEECAKKMKRLKELNKKTDDDCDRNHFSILQFFNQLRVQQADLQNSSSNLPLSSTKFTLKSSKRLN
ncbi:hypothetical protein KR054_003678 [Drosophila jambulina]|nr:hypothetical protein KR054_003678 [Drosophila jambulina]